MTRSTSPSAGRWPLPALCAAVLLAGSVTPVAAWQQGPVDSAKADAIRDTLTRPPPRSGATVGDFVEAPFRLVAFPIDLALDGVAELAVLATKPEVLRPARSTYDAVRSAGFRPAFTTDLGSRSGPGLALAWTGLPALEVRSGGSIRGYQRHSARVAVDRLWRRPDEEPRTTLHLEGEYLLLTQEVFWARTILGEDEPTDYLQEGGSATVRLTRRVAPGFRLQASVAWEDHRVGPGQDDALDDLVKRALPGAIPGLDAPLRFLSVDGGLALRRVGVAEGRPRGVEVELGGRVWNGQAVDLPDFGRLRSTGALHWPLGSHHHLTVRSTLRHTVGGDGRVPFTHLPTLGGGETLRSFEWGRFRGRTALSASAELRWEVWRDIRERARVEGLLFTDQGSVGSGFGELDSRRTSWGLGLTARWLQEFSATGYVAFGDEGSRLSGTLSTEIP